MDKIFSLAGLLVLVILGGAWFLLGSGGSDSQQSLTKNVPIGVSESLNTQSVERFGLDLTKNLDPKIVPSLLEQAMKETVDSGVEEAEFLATLVSKISNKIRDVSTIDLNDDGLADPILVVPQTQNSEKDFLTFSILVPDPAKVSALPSGSDQAAWRDIVENKAVEVMTASVVRSGEEKVTLQTAPNPQMYSATSMPYYHYSPPSFGTMFLASMAGSMMANWLFAPSYNYGGYNHYSGPPRAVTTVQSSRAGALSNLRSATPQTSAARTAGGNSVTANRFRATSTKSLNQIKSTQFRAANRSQTTSTKQGFGRSSSTSTVRKTTPAPQVRRQTPPRKSSSFGRKKGFGRRR